jgi:tetratricopeptide (TPR) repeat protein
LLLLSVVALAVGYFYVARERDEKDRALLAAKANAAAAEANLRLAKKAVDGMYDRLADKLNGQPFRQHLGQEILREALTYYQEFAKQQGADPAVRFGVGHAYLRIGQIHGALYQPLQAEEACRQAIARLEPLVAEHPAEVTYVRELATAHSLMGGVFGQVKLADAAVQVLRRARALWAQLAADFPDVPEYRFHLALACGQLSSALPRGHADAEVSARTAIRLCETLVAEYPENLAYQCQLIVSHMVLGRVQAAAGRHTDAVHAFREALRLWTRSRDTLLAHNGGGLLAMIHGSLGASLQAMNQLPEAEGAYRQAVAQYEEYLDKAFLNTSSWIEVYSCIGGLVRLYEQTGRPQEAVKLHRRALDSYEKYVANLPDDAAYQEGAGRIASQLAGLLRIGGERPEREEIYRRALELTERLAARFPTQPGSHSRAAYWHNNLGLLLTAAGRNQEAERCYRQAAARYRSALDIKPDHVGSLNNLAWLLVTCPETQLRDANRAVQLANKAIELEPQRKFLWNTLGVARYRAGDWKGAVTALEKSMALYSLYPESLTEESYSTFVLAMAQWRLGDKDEARRWYDRAVRWMDKYEPNQEELRCFRAEAADLLGVKNEQH